MHSVRLYDDVGTYGKRTEAMCDTMGSSPVELVDTIHVYEGGEMKIEFNFQELFDTLTRHHRVVPRFISS